MAQDDNKTIKDKDTWSYLLKMPLAVLPAGLIGLFFMDFFEQFKTSTYVGIFLLFTAVVLLIPKLLNGRRENITFLDSIQVGLAQVISLLPGISRSGMTTVAGMSRGLTKERAFSFSFMVFLPLSFISGVYRNDYALTLALNIVNGHSTEPSDYIPWELVHVGKNTSVYANEVDIQIPADGDHWDFNTEFTVMFDNWKNSKMRKEYITIKDMDFHIMNDKLSCSSKKF